jgi:hypothetical protein
MGKKQLSIILLVVGLALIGWGYNVSGGFESQLSSTFSGRPSDEALVFYIAGGILALIGVVGLVKK